MLPGFDCKLFIPEPHDLWIEHLRANGFDVPMNAQQALQTEPERPAEFGISAFLTDHLLTWLDQQNGPWFAHASYLRPHPPYAAAGKWSTAYDPADVELPIPHGDDLHPSHQMFLQLPDATAPLDEAGKRHMRAQYYGMISDVDEQLGRVWDKLADLGMWENTMIIITADHGEQLGDHGLKEKLGFFPQSYHILGLVRDPRNTKQHGTVVDKFTENIDIFPTIADALEQPVPLQCDGLPLTPFLTGATPQSGATQQHTNTTGDQCLFAWARAIGRGISDSSNNISPLVAMTIAHTCNLATVRRCRSTLQPTRPGAHTSMTLRQHWRWPKTCWSGDRVIQTELCQEC